MTAIPRPLVVMTGRCGRLLADVELLDVRHRIPVWPSDGADRSEHPTLPMHPRSEAVRTLSHDPAVRRFRRSPSWHGPVTFAAPAIAAAFAHGADDFVGQPFSPQGLLERMRVTLVRTGRLRAEGGGT